jgi:hypothetical protein
LYGMNKSLIHIRTDGLDGLAQLVRHAREPCFPCALFTVGSHPQDAGLLIKTSWDNRDKISPPFFECYLISSYDIEPNTLVPVDFALYMTVKHTHDCFIPDLLFHIHLLYGTVHSFQQDMSCIALRVGAFWRIPCSLLCRGRTSRTMRTWISYRT